MSATVAERLVSLFVAGTAERGEEATGEAGWVEPNAPVTAVASSVAVLATRRDAAAAGAAAGLALGGCALVCTWLGEDEQPAVEAARVPPTPAARRLAERLAHRDLDVTPAGRLVRLALPGDEIAAVRAARGAFAAAAAADAAAVLALGGARGRELEDLLAAQDRVVVVSRRGDEAFAAVAARRIAHRAVTSCAADPTAAGRALALAGAWVAPCLRPVAAAVGQR